MKRLVAALATAILIAGLLPATALAKPYSGIRDQANETNTGGYNNLGSILGQTFTVGNTGNLNRIDLYLISLAGNSTSIELTTPDLNSNVGWSDPSTIGTSYGWVTFTFSFPVPVVAGRQYGITIDTTSITDIGYSGDLYAGGQAREWAGSGWTAPGIAAVEDFNFRTWIDPQVTTLAWDKAQVTAGAATSLQLTETVVFPEWNGVAPSVVRPNAGQGVSWAVNAISLPSWFTPSQIACSAHILPADCTIANATGTGSMPVATVGGAITITLTGTATPAAANVGNASGSARGCATYVGGFGEVCVTGSAGIQVAAAPAPPTATAAPTQQPAPATSTPHVTLPPTSATQTPDRPDGSPMALLIVLMALAGLGSVASMALRRR